MEPITVLDCDVALYFHIRWSGGIIEVLREGATVIRYKDDNPLTVRHMAAFSTNDARAEFRFAHVPGA